MSVVLEQIFQVGFLAAIMRIATPLAFATLGEMFPSAPACSISASKASCCCRR